MEQQSTLSVKSLGHVLHAFVNGEHVGKHLPMDALYK